MISFKAFVEAVHEAIISASNTLMDKNVGLLDKYFEESSKDVSNGESGTKTKSTLIPKNVVLEYPILTADGNVETTEIQVPLITMVPLSMSQIEKATLTADFEMQIVDGELQLSFPGRKNDGVFHKKSKTTTGKLEITISPQESSEGLKLIVEGYEAVLKRQLS
jgi:hypothetical protein